MYFIYWSESYILHDYNILPSWVCKVAKHYLLKFPVIKCLILLFCGGPLIALCVNAPSVLT